MFGVVLLFKQVAGEGVFQAAHRMAQAFAGRDGVDVFGLEDLVLVILVNGALLGDQEAGTALYTAGAQHQCRRDASAVGDAARRQNRDVDRIADLRNQGHGGQLADVAAGLTALGDDCEGAASFHQFCHGGGSNYRDNLDARSDPFLHVLARIARASDDDRNLLLDDKIGNLVSKGAHQHDVDAKSLVSELAGLVDFLAQPVSVGIHRCDDAQSSGVADRCRQRSVGDPGHAALEDGVLNIQKFTKFCLNHRYSFLSLKEASSS